MQGKRKQSGALNSKSKPLVSVVIPFYNTGKSTIKQLISVFKNDYQNYEIVLIDDGSTDDSFALVKEFVRQYKIKKSDSRKIQVLTKENGGVSSARNLGIKKASGEFIIFIDSDDTVEEKYISSLVDAITKYDDYNSNDLKTALATCGVKYFRENSENFLKTLKEKILKKSQKSDTEKPARELFKTEITPRQPGETFEYFILRLLATDGRLYAVNNKIFRKNIIDHFDLKFDEKVNFAEDTKFVLDYLKVANKVKYSRLEFITEPLYNYHYGTENSVVKTTSLSWGNWQKSFNSLTKWTGKHPTKDEEKMLRRVLLRWKISHVLAVARSNQSFSHKLQHTNFFALLPALLIVKIRK